MADIRHATKNGREILTVGGDLTVKHAKALKSALLDALLKASAVDVNVEHIADLDVTFIQLVCSAHQTAADLNKQMTISGIEQEPFSRMLGRFGFFRHIGCHESARTSCQWLHGREHAGQSRPAEQGSEQA